MSNLNKFLIGTLLSLVLLVLFESAYFFVIRRGEPQIKHEKVTIPKVASNVEPIPTPAHPAFSAAHIRTVSRTLQSIDKDGLLSANIVYVFEGTIQRVVELPHSVVRDGKTITHGIGLVLVAAQGRTGSFAYSRDELPLLTVYELSNSAKTLATIQALHSGQHIILHSTFDLLQYAIGGVEIDIINP